MTTYRTSKGAIIDMASVRETNKDTIAAGNARMNANGDTIENGGIVRPARKAAQSTHNVSKEVRSVGLKGKVDEITEESSVKNKKEEKQPTKASEKKLKKPKEIELEDGSIQIQEDDEQ